MLLYLGFTLFGIGFGGLILFAWFGAVTADEELMKDKFLHDE